MFFCNEQQIKRELKGIHICGCPCNERLKAKTDGSMRLAYTEKKGRMHCTLFLSWSARHDCSFFFLSSYRGSMRPIWLAAVCTLAAASAFALPAASLASLHVLECKTRLQTSGISHSSFTFSPSIVRGATDTPYGASRAMVRLSHGIGTAVSRSMTAQH